MVRVPPPERRMFEYGLCPACRRKLYVFRLGDDPEAAVCGVVHTDPSCQQYEVMKVKDFVVWVDAARRPS